MYDDDFARDGALAVGDDKEVNAFRIALHVVVVTCAFLGYMGFKSVDIVASNVKHLYGDATVEAFKIEAHLSAVGVGDDTDVSLTVVGFKLIDADIR